jgi:hypothetical protein
VQISELRTVGLDEINFKRQAVCRQDVVLCVAPSIAGISCLVISQGNRALALSRLVSGLFIAIAQSIQPALEQLLCMDFKALHGI